MVIIDWLIAQMVAAIGYSSVTQLGHSIKPYNSSLLYSACYFTEGNGLTPVCVVSYTISSILLGCIHSDEAPGLPSDLSPMPMLKVVCVQVDISTHPNIDVGNSAHIFKQPVSSFPAEGD